MIETLAGSWTAAKAKGASHYFTGKACKRGHVSKRLASTGQCLECLRERMRQQYRADPEAGRAKTTAYRLANPDKVRAALRDWELRNREHRAAYERGRYAMPDSKRRVTIANRKAQKRRARPAWYGEFDALVMVEASALAVQREQVTGIRWEVDHAIPLRGKWASGFHCGANVQVIPARLNKVKSNTQRFTEPLSWLQGVA